MLTFVGVFSIALIVDLLARSFGGQRDSLAALKLTAYSFTPGWIAARCRTSFQCLHSGHRRRVLWLVPALSGPPGAHAPSPGQVDRLHDRDGDLRIVMWVGIGALTTCTVTGLGFAVLAHLAQ